MANTATEKTTTDSLKFEPDVFTSNLSQRYKNSLGWVDDVAKRAAAIALDVLLDTHGGRNCYIPKRLIDEAGILEAKKLGWKNERISRFFGVSTRTIVRICNSDKSE